MVRSTPAHPWPDDNDNSTMSSRNNMYMHNNETYPGVNPQRVSTPVPKGKGTVHGYRGTGTGE